MKHNLKLSNFFTVFATLFSALLPVWFSGSVMAQETVPELTPREQIVRGLGLDAANPDIADRLDNERKAQKTRSDLPKKMVRAAAPISEIAPYYLSAQDYLDMRAGQKGPQTVLSYDVQSNSATGAGLAAIQEVILTLGADFAAVKTHKNTTIYDFKLNRILKIKPEYSLDGKTTGKTLFENTSLYAKVYRDIGAVRTATQNGRLKKLNMGGSVTLDAFWIESAMSWAALAPDGGVDITDTSRALKVKRGNEVIFDAEFSAETYADDYEKNVLLALAHLEWPLHPTILRALYAYDAPPKRFEMLSYGPLAPNGQKQIWVLKGQAVQQTAFPLPADAIGTAQLPKISPLVYIVNEAVTNRARGGIQSVQDMTREFNAKLNAEKYWQAWIIGQKYIAYSGACKNPDNPKICNQTAKIERNHKEELPKRIQNYMTAMDYAGRPGLKGDAIKLSVPYLDKKETPAFLVRTIAMARAKMKSAQASRAGVEDMNAETLLQAALAKDPYDPNTYIGLAQVLAAQGAIEQSWDIYDALRAGIPTANSVNLKINRLEKNLKKSAPGYFLQP